MQILLSFFFGYFVGAKAGGIQFDEVVESAGAVAESDEMHSRNAFATSRPSLTPPRRTSSIAQAQEYTVRHADVIEKASPTLDVL